MVIGDRLLVIADKKGVVRTSVTLLLFEVTSFGWSAQSSVESVGGFFCRLVWHRRVAGAPASTVPPEPGFGAEPQVNRLLKPHF